MITAHHIFQSAHALGVDIVGKPIEQIATEIIKVLSRDFCNTWYEICMLKLYISNRSARISEEVR